MRNPQDLQVMPVATELAVIVYKLTAEFPATERYGLTSQLRRAVVSIGANIAEGCGREGDRAMAAFCQIALGSAHELEFLICLARRLEIGQPDLLDVANKETIRIKKMLSRLILYLRNEARH